MRRAAQDGLVSRTRGPAVRRSSGWDAPIWILLTVLCGAVFLDALDVSMIAVALPSMGAGLDLERDLAAVDRQHLILGYGGFLLLGGRISDLVSRPDGVPRGGCRFGLASVLSALMSDETLLVALRFIKGASAGFTVPACLSILTTTFAEGAARNRALGIYASAGPAAFFSAWSAAGF